MKAARPDFIKEKIMAKFISKSHVAINVVLQSGANVHVTFLEKTGGGSVLYTDNADLILALRSHRKYGKLFREVEMPVAQPAPKKAAVNTGAPAASAPVASQPVNKQQPQQTQAPEPKEVSFKNVEDAKDYMAERYGISRSKMKTRGAIEQVAKAEGIKVNWI